MTDTPKEDWYPDPFGRHEHRYWDGARWTEHVSSSGKRSVDQPVAPSQVPTGDHAPEQVQRQVQRAGGAGSSAFQGGGSPMNEPVLVVNQKAKFMELNTEYAIHSQDGTQIGAIRQVGQSQARKALRALTSVDQYLTHTLQVVDAAGTVLLSVTRPGKVFKSKIHVSDAAGNQIGSIVQQNMMGKIRFSLEADGTKIGSLNAENWRAWNFHILDASDVEVARITKTWEGLGKTMFTTADHYVLAIQRPLEDPLRSMVVATAAAVDLALKQDKRGFN